MKVDFEQEPGEKGPKGGGNNTRLLLLVLVLLVAVFGYLYYFTGLIKSREEAKAPEPVQTSQVKQPIPPRPEEKPAAAPPEAAKPEPPKPEAPVAKKEEPKVAAVPTAAKPEEKKAEAAKPAPEKAKAEPAKVAKKEAVPEKKAAPSPAEKTKGPAKPGEKKVAQAPAADKGKPAPREKEAKKAAPAPEKPKAVVKKESAAPEKPKAAKPAPVKMAAVTEKTAGKKTAAAGVGGYTLRVGEYVVATAMDKDREKIQEAGLTPVVRQGAKKKEPMVRLFLGEFADRESANRELAKLRDDTVDGFVLNEGGKYRVYAGSYFVHERAAREQERLAARGIRSTLRKTAVSVPTLLLTTGKFESRDEALKEAAKLRKKGLAPVVIENAR